MQQYFGSECCSRVLPLCTERWGLCDTGPEVGHGDCVGSRVGAWTVSSEAKAHRKRGFHSVTCFSHGACLSCWEEALARGAAVCHVWPTAVAKGPRDAPRPRHASGSHPGASRLTPSGRGPRLHPVYPLSLGSWEAAPWGLGCRAQTLCLRVCVTRHRAELGRRRDGCFSRGTTDVENSSYSNTNWLLS